jgi:hypothetical protein
VCRVTFEGSFHSRTFSKVARALVGYITSAIVAEAGCTGGSARALPTTLPWHLQYASFTGTLPDITGIRLRVVGAGFQIQEPIVTCLYRTSEAEPLFVIAHRNTETGRLGLFEAEPNGGIRALSPCTVLTLEGNATITKLGFNFTPIVVTLVA